eukprot:TRINITY_DN419_c8_g1_i1.p1 TRINITY_DN419_c8_g1~~TRINITY_DN419_c8_g1_i1.p1  ORF type:complete len:188 (+),score=24.84 TRINITY_DN419_c8_g1_i1:182-745(+)
MDIVIVDSMTCGSHTITVQCYHTINDVINLVQRELGYQGVGLEYCGEEIQPGNSLFIDTGITSFEEVIVTPSWGEELQKAKKGVPLDELPEWTRSIEPIVWECITRNGEDLQFASPELQSDQRLVLAAVQQKGTALKYASPELKNNLSIVLEAIRQEGESFFHASDDLRREEMVISEARWSGIMICV